MTVPTTDNKQFANGNGVTTVFYFSYRLLLASDLEVYVNTALISSSDYTVVINPNGVGGSVTFNTAPAAGVNNVLIYRFVDYLQETHFPNESDFNQISLEDCVDKLTMECQQLQEEVDRCVIFPVTAAGIPDLHLPPYSPGDAIGWNPNALALANIPITGEVGPTGPSGTGVSASGEFIGYNSFTILFEHLCTVAVSDEDNWSYVVTFNTPLPDANYVVAIEYEIDNHPLQVITVESKLAAGFTIQANTADGGSQNPTQSFGKISFAVFSSTGQGQPGPTGPSGPSGPSGTGSIAAFGSINSTGTFDASVNLASVVRNGDLSYTVTFSAPITAPYAPFLVSSGTAAISTPNIITATTTSIHYNFWTQVNTPSSDHNIFLATSHFLVILAPIV